MVLAILSRKVLLRSCLPYTEETFGYALVVVSGEEIADVIEIDQTLSVDDVLSKYSHWDIEVCEKEYVLPGMIDLEVRCNGEWGNAETESRAAISGGVTFFLEEPSLYSKSLPSAHLYCDVGHCHVLTSPDPVRELLSLDFSTLFAVKAYLSPPSSFCPGIKDHLGALLRTKCEVPLMVDCFMPADSSLRVNSPFRLSGLEEREHEQLSSRLNPGDGFSNEVTPCAPDDDKTVTLPLFNEKHIRNTSCSDVVEELFKYRKLQGNQKSYEVLSKISLLGYSNCGTTSFQYSREADSSKMQLAVPERLSEGPRMRRRPSAISVQPVRNMEMDEYVMYFGQYPEDNELTGVNYLITCLGVNDNTAQLRVHVTNLCSAAAICLLIDYKPDFKGSLSVDTAPHYLYWTQDQVDAGNTRFKVVPPVRCKENQEFLWKLLRARGIDTISSHHTSVSLDYKFLSSGSFKRAISGISSLGYTLPALISKANRNSTAALEQDLLLFSLTTSTRPANVIGISNKRGTIQRRKYADLVVVDLFADPKCHPGRGKHPDLSPFASETLAGKIVKVMVRGRVAFANSELFPVGRDEVRSTYC